MSRIALTPNASGTGTLTIAAPNTNTDQTLTLPDVTGTFVTADAVNGFVGIGTSAPSVALQVNGSILQTGFWGIFRGQITPFSATGSTTLTQSTLYQGVRYTGGSAGNLTMPLGTSIDLIFPGNAAGPNNISTDFFVVNTGGAAATILTNTGVTLIGNMIVTNGTSGVFRVHKTAASTYNVYRIS